jgi:hypothetical protein
VSDIDLALSFLGFVLTLMIFSYIAGDNVFFRLALYLLVGVSAGYTAAVLILKVIIPYLITPLAQVGSPQFFLALFPLAGCILITFMYFPHTANAGRLPLAILVGILAGVSIIGIARGTLAPQLINLINYFSPHLLQTGSTIHWMRIIQAFTMLLGVIAVLFYFHHRVSETSTPPTRSSLVEGLGSVGQIFIGITFGAIFVGVYATALLALIGRLLWIKEFLQALF